MATDRARLKLPSGFTWLSVLHQQQVEKRYRRSNGPKRCESSNVTDPADYRSASQRSKYDSTPKTRSNQSHFSWRKTFDAAADAQQRALQGVAHLHERETEEEGEKLQ